MAQADSLKETSTFAKVNDLLQLLSSKKMAQYFNEWMTPSSILKYFTPAKS